MSCLGKAIDESPTWDSQVRSISNKTSSGTGVIIRVSLSLLLLNWLVSIRWLLNYTWLLQRHTYGKWHQRPLQWQTSNGTKSCVSSQLPTNGYLRRNYCANLAGPISRRGEREKTLTMFKSMNDVTLVYLKDLFSSDIERSVWSKNVRCESSFTGC